MTDAERPSVSLFVDHTRFIWEHHRFGERRLLAYAAGFDRADDKLVLYVTDGNEVGQVHTNCLHLCLGQMAPFYPNWARTHRGHNPRVSHVFDRDFETCELPEGDEFIVVGGGITAGQVVRTIIEKLHRRVRLITRRPLSRGLGTTSSEDWKDPERRAHLCSLEWSARFETLRKEGDRGTMPPWEMERLERFMASGDLVHEILDIAHCVPSDDHVMLIDTNGRPIRGAATVLTTGMMPVIPDWLLHSARRLKLPFDDRGRPVLGDNLQWGEHNIFLHGVFARPVLGPYAPNVIGARLAADITSKQFVC